MKHIIAILLFACGLATAQVNPPTTWRSSRTAPSGNCPAGTGVETIPGGVLYTCQNGTWTQISGGGGASLAPFTTDGTNVTLPSGTLSAGTTTIDPVNGVWSPERDAYNRYTLRNWQALTAIRQNSGGGTPRLTWIGDSWVYNEVMTGPLRTYLQQIYGNAGCGYVTIANATNFSPACATVTRSGTWTDTLNSASSWGIDASSTNSSDTATPGTINVTATATTWVVHYLAQPGGGSFTWAFDGGGATTISTAAGSIAYTTATLTAQTNASHALALKVTVAGTAGVTLMGVEPNIVGGARIDRIGAPGAQVSTYTALNATAWEAGLTALNPAAVILTFGVNELPGNVPPATQIANFQTLISRISAALPYADIVLVTPTDLGITGTYTMGQYVSAQMALAMASGLGFLNSYENLGTYAAANTRGLMTNTTHVNAYGGQIIASNLISYLNQGALPILGQGQIYLPGNLTVAQGITASAGPITAMSGYVQSPLGLRGFNAGTILLMNTDNTALFNNSGGTGHLQIWYQPIGTIASGFGTSPSVTGTDGGGSVTVGSGGTATTGVINFAHTWGGVPQCVANDNTTLLFVQAKATVTTLTLTAATVFGAGDVVVWHCQRSY